MQDESLIAYYETHRSYIEWRHGRIFDYLQRAFGLDSGRFLDIGSGMGYALSVASARGWQASGIEPGEVLANYASAELGVDVTQGFFDPAHAALLRTTNPAGYDYLLIDNVLEHVDNPVGFLEAALGLLTDRGVALVAVPPVDWLRLALTLPSRIRRYSRSAQLNLFYDPEQHVNYFSRQAVRQLIEDRLEHCLLPNRFHHSRVLNNPVARLCGFETGYYFIRRDQTRTTV